MTGAEPYRIARQGIAYVPEGRGIFPNLTVRENLVMAARAGPDGRRDWTYERVLATFPRLAERLAHGGWQLSGGEQQMLTIGRALMTNPDLLILDEATEGLAPQIAQEIWRIIGEIRAHGIATVIVDKNYRAVTAIADRNVILVKGRVVFEGDSRDAARAAGHPAQASRRVAPMPFVTVAAHRIEYERIEVARAPRPTLVFLHEGLGSVAMWRDFPGRVAHADELQRRRLFALRLRPVRSARGGPRRSRYMHDEALVALPELLDALAHRPADPGRPQRRRLDRADPRRGRRAPGGRRRHAGRARAGRGRFGREHRRGEGRRTRRPICARGSRAITPTSIRRSWGWNRIWLAPEFRAWNIEEYLPRIACPVLAIQGEDDEYGTMEQMRRIGAQVRDVELLALQDCRHSPHRDQPEAVIEAITRFVDRVGS